MHKLLLLTGAAAFALAGAAAFAQSPVKSKASPSARTAASIECSRQADAKGLHGKGSQVVPQPLQAGPRAQGLTA